MSQQAHSPETADGKKTGGSTAKKIVMLGLKALAVIIVLFGLYAAARIGLVAYANYCHIQTPRGTVVVKRGHGADLEWDIVNITLDELNRRIGELSPREIDGVFSKAFREEAERKLAAMGYELARPGEKPDPEKAQQIVVALVEGEFWFRSDAKRDGDADGKPEFGSLQELQASGDPYVPAELVKGSRYQGYVFEITVADTPDERETGFVIRATPTDGKESHFYADQTGVIRKRRAGPPNTQNPQVEKVDPL